MGTVLPIIYIWILPNLHGSSIFSNEDFAVNLDEYPNKLNSISNYICTAQANGGFAAVIYFPLFQMWISPTKIKDRGVWITSKSGLSLLALTIGF